MLLEYSIYDFGFYLLFYSFVGWCAEALAVSVMDKNFVNRGVLNLPFHLPYGITAAILMITLPTLHHHYVLQYFMTVFVFYIVESLSNLFVKGMTRKFEFTHRKQREETRKQRWENFFLVLLIAAVYLILYLTVHPFVFTLVTISPEWLIKWTVLMWGLLVVVDFISVWYALRTHRVGKGAKTRKKETKEFGQKLCDIIWKRLDRAYPGIRESENIDREYTFAKGLCLAKLIWVFLISAFLGALIEMVYCRVRGGTWMNRSSLLYGTFSVVWGLGAVVLTVSLQRFAHQEDRKVFLGGFVIGGTYEYLCSVFTELVFGTVFWDYSHMPLNINGRTNVLYCIFWGLLAVIWVKIIYPPMEKAIEKIPPLIGQILTWVVFLVILCDALLTGSAMIRYTDRKSRPEAANPVEQLLDDTYDDAWMEQRWPNMAVPK